MTRDEKNIIANKVLTMIEQAQAKGVKRPTVILIHVHSHEVQFSETGPRGVVAVTAPAGCSAAVSQRRVNR